MFLVHQLLPTGVQFTICIFGYHLATFLFHIGAAFFVYKTVQNLTNDFKAALIAGLIYGAHPAHFVSLFWISGGATTIGFFFLISAIYCYLLKKQSASLTLYLLAIFDNDWKYIGNFSDHKICLVYFENNF